MGFSFDFSGVPGTPAGTTPPFMNSEGGVNWAQFLVSQEQLVANTFLANKSLGTKAASSIQINPNGTITAAGGGAGIVGAGSVTATSLFSNPIVLIFLVLALILLVRRLGDG